MGIRRGVPAATLLALGISLLGPGGALAADPEYRTAATYTLDPAAGVVHVTVVITVANHTADTTKSVPCTNYYVYPDGTRVPFTDTCTQTTFFYIDRAEANVDPFGTSFAASTSGGGASVAVEAGGE